MANEVTIVVRTKADPRNKAATDAVRKEVDGVGSSLKRIGEVAGGVALAGFFTAAAAAAGLLARNVIKAASGLEQAVGGTKAVFGGASAEIDAFAKKAATAVGLSEREFREMTTLVGGQLKRMTGDVRLASSASIDLAKTAADLAATYGGTTKEAMDAFAAALRGEADPAERFNLNLKTSVIQAKAVEMGLAKSVSTVNQAAYAQALLAAVTEQTGDAQGQFAREIDTAAVAAQRASASWEDAQAKLGQALLPALASVANALTTVISGFTGLSGPVRTSIIVVTALGVAALIVVPRIAALKVAMAELNITMASTKTAAGGVASFLAGPWGVALAAATAGIFIWKAEQDKARATVTALSEQIDVQTGRLNDNGRATRARQLVEDRYVKSLLEHGVSEADLTAAIDGSTEALARAHRALGDGSPLMTERLDRVVRERQELEAQAAAQAKSTAALEGGKSATEAATGAVASHTAAVTEDTNALQRNADELRKQTDPMFALIEAQQAVAESQANYRKAVKEHGKTSKEARDAELELARAALELQGAVGEAANTFTGELSPAFRETLRAAGLTDKQIAGVEQQFREAAAAGNAYAKPYRAEVSVTDFASKVIANLQDRLAAVKSKRITVSAVVHWTQSGDLHVPGGTIERAHGGISGAASGGVRAGLTMVGERGRELVRLPFGSTVIPNNTTEAMMAGAAGGGAGDVFHIGTVNLYGVQRPEELVKGLQSYNRSNGPIRGVRFATT